MSQKSFVEFYETYLPSEKGKDSVAKLKGVKDEAQYCAIAVEAGRAAGFDFTPDDVLKVMKQSEAKKQASGELSEDQLEGAVGGAIYMSPTPTVNLGSSLSIGTLPSASPTLAGLKPGGIEQQTTVMCPW